MVAFYLSQKVEKKTQQRSPFVADRKTFVQNDFLDV